MSTETLSIKDFLLSVPVPKQTNTYKPMSHGQLMTLVTNSIANCGYTLDKEQFKIAKNGLEATAIYTIKDMRDADMQLTIAWQNSYNKHLPLKFAIGAQVFACANGTVRGDMGNLRRKHQGNIQEVSPIEIENYIKSSQSIFNLLVDDKEHFKHISLPAKERAELYGDMYFNHNLITPHQLSVIKRETVKPTHDYNAPESAWEAMQYVTYALKTSTPANWLKSHSNVHKYFLDTFPNANTPKMLPWNGEPMAIEI